MQPKQINPRREFIQRWPRAVNVHEIRTDPHARGAQCANIGVVEGQRCILDRRRFVVQPLMLFHLAENQLGHFLRPDLCALEGIITHVLAGIVGHASVEMGNLRVELVQILLGRCDARGRPRGVHGCDARRNRLD